MARHGNALRLINEKLRKVNTIKIKCTVTTANGTTEELTARVAVNKICKLNGNGLNGHTLYQLKKTGKVETTDIFGNKFIYELLAGTERGVQVGLNVNVPEEGAEDVKPA